MAGRGSWRTEPLPAGWAATRARILARDPQCTWGLVPGEAQPGYLCPASSTDVDHVVRGGGEGDANLRGLCHEHHKAKSSGEGGSSAAASRRAMAAAKFRPPERHPGLKRAG